MNEYNANKAIAQQWLTYWPMASIQGTAGQTVSTLSFVNTGAGTGQLSNVGSAVTFAFQPGVTTAANWEAAVFPWPQISILTPTTLGASKVLQNADAFAPIAFNPIANQQFTLQLPCPDVNSVVILDNVPFAFDDDVVDQTASYARLKIIGAASSMFSLGKPGTRRVLRDGYVNALLATPVNSGRKPNDLLVMACRQVLEGQHLGVSGGEVGVHLEAASAAKQSTDGEFWYRVVTIPFTFYDTV